MIDYVTMFHERFPLIRVKGSSRDPPFMSPLVKHLCNIRNKRSHTCSVTDNIMRQERINSLIRKLNWLGIFHWFGKAFDSVSHEIVCNKLGS